MESARFMQYMTAPSGDCFCFSDSPVEAECNMMMFWFAGKAKDLSLLWIERQYLDRPDMQFAEDRLLPSLMVFCSQLDLNRIGKPKKTSGSVAEIRLCLSTVADGTARKIPIWE